MVSQCIDNKSSLACFIYYLLWLYFTRRRSLLFARFLFIFSPSVDPLLQCLHLCIWECFRLYCVGSGKKIVVSSENGFFFAKCYWKWANCLRNVAHSVSLGCWVQWHSITNRQNSTTEHIIYYYLPSYFSQSVLGFCSLRSTLALNCLRLWHEEIDKQINMRERERD